MALSDRWYRFIHSLKIRTNDPETNRPRVLPLSYNEAQRKVWAMVADKIDHAEPIRLIILKARRMGLSTMIESWLLSYIASTDHVNALITAHMRKPAREIWNMSKLFVTSSPMLSAVAEIDQQSIRIGASRLLVATAGSPESERGGDLTAAHFSEAAFYRHPEVMLATMQALPQNQRVFSIGVIESTPNGKVGDGEMFYDEWCRAEDGYSDWIPVLLRWFDFVNYQLPGLAIEDPDAEELQLREQYELSDAYLAWRRWCIRNNCGGSVRQFRQEYPSDAESCFIQSGLPFFEPEELLSMEKHITKGTKGKVDLNGTFTASPDGYLTIFRSPQPGHWYVCGADSSFGIEDRENARKEHSRSAGEVIDMDTMEQVAEYDAATPPHVMARHLVGIGRMYNDALLAPEVQSSGGGGGRELIVYIRELDYWNIHRWRGQIDKIQRDPGHLLGWETNARTRPRMLARIREVVMEKSAIIHSRRLLTQLASFGESDSGRVEALAGHDDLLFAWGIALVSRSENWYVAPTSTGSFPITEPDWTALGIHVTREEEPMDRLKRLLAQARTEAPEKSFMEL